MPKAVNMDQLFMDQQILNQLIVDCLIVDCLIMDRLIPDYFIRGSIASLFFSASSRSPFPSIRDR